MGLNSSSHYISPYGLKVDKEVPLFRLDCILVRTGSQWEMEGYSMFDRLKITDRKNDANHWGLQATRWIDWLYEMLLIFMSRA